MAESASIAYDEALTKTIGQFGPGQWRAVLWASMFCICNAAAFFFWTFATVDPVANHSWGCNSPADAACAAAWQLSTPTSQEFCGLQADQWHWTSQDSLVAKFNLVCADAWKIQFANSLIFLGAFIGAGIFGLLCDRWGRRNPIFLSTALIAVPMFASLAANNYWAMAVLRCVTGIGAAGQAQCIFLLATEPVGPDFRGFAGTLTLLAFTVGEFIMVALGFALPSWQHLLIACASTNAAAALLLYPLVSESARWLLSRGHTEQAKAVLQHIARVNKSSMPAQPLVVSRSRAQLQVLPTDTAGTAGTAATAGTAGSTFAGTSTAADTATEEGQHVSTGTVAGSLPADQDRADMGLWQLLKQRQFAARLFVLLVNWFGLMLNYYGISMGAGGIPGSIYVTFAIGVCMEVVALLLVCPALDRFGRHNLLAFGQLLGGGACVGCALVSNGTTQAVLAGIGKFGCSVGQPAMLIYTAELVPTYCRSSVFGMCGQASRLGSLVAPFLLMLGAQLDTVGGYSQMFIAFMVFGCLALMGGFMALFMPETLGAAMPETSEDLDALLSAFSAKPWRKGCIPTLSFIFRTKAAFTYPTYSCKTCRAHTCACFKTDMPLDVLNNTDGCSQRAAGESARAQGLSKDTDGASNAGTGVEWQMGDAGRVARHDQYCPVYACT